MSFWDKAKARFQAVINRFQSMMCCVRIILCKVLKRVLLWVWKGLSALGAYAYEHSKELICNLIMTILAGIISGYILFWLTTHPLG